MPLSPAEMQASIIENLSRKTGRDLAAWLAALDAAGLTDRRSRIAWLKEHGVGHVTAQVIAQRAANDVAEYEVGTDGFLRALFGAPTCDLHRRYLEVRDAVTTAVPGTRVTVCKGYVGFSLGRQYAAVRARDGEIELGLRLPPDGQRLAPARRFGGGGITGMLRVGEGLSADDLELVASAADSRTA